jgi:hypothetical protein
MQSRFQATFNCETVDQCRVNMAFTCTAGRMAAMKRLETALKSTPDTFESELKDIAAHLPESCQADGDDESVEMEIHCRDNQMIMLGELHSALAFSPDKFEKWLKDIADDLRENAATKRAVEELEPTSALPLPEKIPPRRVFGKIVEDVDKTPARPSSTTTIPEAPKKKKKTKQSVKLALVPQDIYGAFGDSTLFYTLLDKRKPEFVGICEDPLWALLCRGNYLGWRQAMIEARNDHLFGRDIEEEFDHKEEEEGAC